MDVHPSEIISVSPYIYTIIIFIYITKCVDNCRCILYIWKHIVWKCRLVLIHPHVFFCEIPSFCCFGFAAQWHQPRMGVWVNHGEGRCRFRGFGEVSG